MALSWRKKVDTSLTKHLFLPGEWPRVKAVTDAPQRETYVRQELLAGLAKRVGKQLCYVGLDSDGWLTYGEQLVDEGEDDNKTYTNEPSPDGAAWYSVIVMIINHGTDLGVRAVHCDQGRLKLHFFYEDGILLRVLSNLIIAFERVWLETTIVDRPGRVCEMIGLTEKRLYPVDDT